jgi:signal transduction histidine kinase
MVLADDVRRPPRLYGLAMDRPLFRRPRARLARLVDVAIVGAVTAITACHTWAFHTVPGPKWLTTPLPLLLALPLLWRRSRALLAASLVFAAIVIQAVASGNSAEGLELIIAGGVAAYSVAVYSDRRRALAGLAVLTVGYTVYALEDHNIRSGRTSELWAGAFFAVALLSAWLFGIFVHSGHERTALQALAAEREQAAHDAVAGERSRLARELHDIVSHNLSVVVLQAGGARAQGENAPAGTLEKIERSSREALVEMRRLLGVLREDEGDHAARLAPQPGIAELEALAAGMEAAGLPVELTIDGAHDDLPPALELSVYRIVQEALTNTLKHAGPARARVQIRRNKHVVTIAVTDDGAGTPGTERSSGSGHGLIGMRERVALFGRDLTAAHRPEGGFAVHATLPLADAS